MKRVNFQAWGRKVNDLRLPAYAMRHEYESRADAVVRAICRSTRLWVCAGPRSEGSALEKGKVTAHLFAMTLGTPCRGGGYSPVAEVWFSLPAEVE